MELSKHELQFLLNSSDVDVRRNFIRHDDEISESTKVKIYEKSIESLKGLVDIQTSDGNWNYDPYMHGMANGMILALHLFQENENGCLPDFLEAPKVWGCDKNEVHEIKQQQTQQNTCECNCRMSD